MPKQGKKFKEAFKQVDQDKKYAVEEAIMLVKKISFVGFNESFDVAVNLGIDPKHSDQNVRGTVVLPKGTGKSYRVLVFAKGEKEKEALDAGADYAGLDDLVAKIEGGWLEFDKIIATPDTMGTVGKLGRVLGPRGLMPNPKIGTVTFDIEKAIKDIKGGKVDFRAEKNGLLHLSLGRIGFSVEDLMENTSAFFETVIKLKPDASKGRYLCAVSFSSTMGPGVSVDNIQVANTFS